ncbi:peptidoglycan-binding protein [Nostocaceae cyanobacterium CENA369]|uniref:Peptidoglycan-binding protein n=1 Tax=Dendronalium phyllosphericum CENA369 TaxID=1725256 RepID=A0A8J7I4T6_9NOST|nr:peptidoglycan-binding protein [Dendronalium phyllosphericum]MBH8574720.1 peptidoglycan-binding protein [Dendronalium phyllosphericum CENA369]
MNRATRSLIFSLGLKQPQAYFPDEKQVCLFNKRPILYRGFTPKSVQESINELQERLYAKGFLENISGKFDFETEEAVKEFQKLNNLRVDGIVGPLSWACLFYPKISRVRGITPPELQDAVKELQTILYEEGFFKKEPDGYFDRETERGVKRFQRVYGLKDDGLVGAATWAVLLGMRQKIDKSFPQLVYFVSPQFLFFWEQLLMISCILLGIYHSPIPSPAPHLNIALATAYALTCIVPFLLECLPLKHSSKTSLPLFKYAPYVLTGIFWKPIINYMGTLFNNS